MIVVTADHAHTMTVAGYPSRGNDILGVVDTTKGMDGIPYTTISYANGLAQSISPEGKRVDVTLDKEFRSREYLLHLVLQLLLEPFYLFQSCDFKIFKSVICTSKVILLNIIRSRWFICTFVKFSLLFQELILMPIRV